MWLAINIGNSRQHWGWFTGTQLVQALDFPLSHWDAQALTPAEQIVVASVTPAHLERWRTLPHVRILNLADVPLSGTYSTLGIDRALNLIAAADAYGCPALVADFGTAITLSAVDKFGRFCGGAILPGLGTQLRALEHFTAALPVVDLPEPWPPLLAHTTEAAIQSGVVRVTLAGLAQFLESWKRQYPNGISVATGGDSERVHRWLPDLFDVQDTHLTLRGICVTVRGAD
ncbi:MAG: pantothenate kinase [Aphanocapsa lilacina HA4352-LM1]|nr:pantothenate kinase [Aphanocapsa lilacina HA4352-LM1]